jgi:serine/threonine protein phosphatase 1
MTTVPAILTLEKNILGRDILVGDIHGAFSLLESALDEINFDETQDRLICVGDLIDRGPESHEVAEYLRQPWFYSTLGNHELNITQGLCRQNKEFFIGVEYCQWLLELSDSEQNKIIKELDILPVAIEIPTEKGLVVAIHAGIIGQNWARFRKKLEADDQETWYAATSCREQYESTNDPGHVKDIAAAIHGHSISNAMKVKGNRYYIDTGMVAGLYREGFGLTMIDAEKPEEPLLTLFRG